MRPVLALGLALFTLCAAGCGGAAAGGSCNKAGFLCSTTETALECRSGVWTALPCRGPAGCSVAKDAQGKDTVKCDMSTNTAGDACASTAENKGICSADGKAIFECRNGVFAQTATCSSCSVQGDKINCAP